MHEQQRLMKKKKTVLTSHRKVKKISGVTKFFSKRERDEVFCNWLLVKSCMLLLLAHSHSSVIHGKFTGRTFKTLIVIKLCILYSHFFSTIYTLMLSQLPTIRGTSACYTLWQNRQCIPHIFLLITFFINTTKLSNIRFRIFKCKWALPIMKWQKIVFSLFQTFLLNIQRVK